jgi:hypothetical protein
MFIKNCSLLEVRTNLTIDLDTPYYPLQLAYTR